MNRITTILLAAAGLLSVTATAQSLNDATEAWAKGIKSSNYQTSGSNLSLTGDGSLYMLNGLSSKGPETVFTFGADEIATGADAYTGNSGTIQLGLTKVTAAGEPQWTLYSKVGEIDANNSSVASTADGGAIVVAKFRHAAGQEALKPYFVDGKGETLTIDWTIEDKSHYNGLVMKVSQDGEIEWTRMLEMAHGASPDGSTDHTSDGLNLANVVVDNSGNLFVSGRLSTDLTLTDDNTTTTIAAHNIDGWNGSTQQSRGCSFILKLDSKGNYVSHLVSDGQAEQDNINTVQIVGNRLYVAGWFKGDGHELGLGGKTVTTTSVLSSLFVAALDTDLNGVWYKALESTLAGSAINRPYLAVLGENVWLAAKAKIAFEADGVTVSTGTLTRDGLLVKLSAADGTLLAGKANGVAQSGFFSPFEGTDGNLYVSSHTLLQGQYLHKFDGETLDELDKVTLFPQFSSDIYNAVVDGTRYYAMSRVGQGTQTKTITTKGGSEITVSALSAIALAYDLPVGVIEGIVLNNVTDGGVELKKFGDTFTIDAVVLPADVANSQLIYSSSDETVVTVDREGAITAIDPATLKGRKAPATAGEDLTAVVTVTAAANPQVKAQIDVTVKNSTAVERIDAQTTRITAGKGAIVVVSDKAQRIDIYNVLGALVVAARVNQGENLITLPAGIYIANGNKLVVR